MECTFFVCGELAAGKRNLLTKGLETWRKASLESEHEIVWIMTATA